MKRNGRRITRREFVGGAIAAVGVVKGAPAILRGQNLNNKLNLAIIGVGGRGGANLRGVAAENIVALCDVNRLAVEAAVARYPQAKTFADLRKVFDNEREFDAVVVSTCEHTHAFATMLALKAGKHVYCEKPLAYNIEESRKIREKAATLKVATQMGIQIHAGDNYRRVVELVQSGSIGAVREAHVWVDRAWGLQSQESATRAKDVVFVTARPEAEPVPDGFETIASIKCFLSSIPACPSAIWRHFGLSPVRHGPCAAHGRAQHGVQATVARGRDAEPDRPRSLRDVPCARRHDARRRGPSAFRRTGLSRFSPVRLARWRLRALSLRGLRVRPPGPVFVQGPRALSKLRPFDDAQGRPEQSRGAAGAA